MIGRLFYTYMCVSVEQFPRIKIAHQTTTEPAAAPVQLCNCTTTEK